MYEQLKNILLNTDMTKLNVEIVEQEKHSEILIVDFLEIEDFVKNKCWFNVKAQVKRKGGEIVFGWALFDKYDMQVAQHHAIWLSPDGEYFDVTPNTPDEKTTFLVDNRVSFDYEKLRYPANIHVFKNEGIVGWGILDGSPLYNKLVILNGHISENEKKYINSILS